MSARYIKYAVFILFFTGLFAGVSLPCGPFLQDRVLEGSDDYVLKPPEVFFYEEIEKIKQTLDSYLNETNSEYKKLLKYKPKDNINTDKADTDELKEALGNAQSPETKNMLKQYEQLRNLMTYYKNNMNDWKWQKYYQGNNFDESKTPPSAFEESDIPKGLPDEFEDYLRGAIFYHKNQLDKAKSVWKKLLQRPEKQRKYRSTWAAFMIGKALLDEHPEESIKWFELTRELSDKGFEDVLGLAAASIGWQARAELNQKDYVKAVELYLIQLAIGDMSAKTSIQMVCSRFLLEDTELQKKAASNRLSRKVFTSYILSRGGPFHEVPSASLIRKWLTAIDSAKINNFEEAGRFAWSAYSVGDTLAAEHWVSMASNDDILANWIEAKMLLQQGKIEEAIKLLVHVARIVSPDDEVLDYEEFDYSSDMGFNNAPSIKIIRGELGTLYLSQKNYVATLDSLIRGGLWEDAAYIAERILTIEELKKYIDKTWPDSIENDSVEKISVPERLRYLFARRLARMDKWKDARVYYPLKWQTQMDLYTLALGEGNNTKISKTKRAAALWKAAVIARCEGMELMGTELEMDWFIYNGNAYRYDYISDIREKMLSNKVASSSLDELQRSKQTKPSEQRFHYRYIAAELAWQAAKLMPDNSDQTARVLCIAGSWIKDKEPEEADKFYKALVNRNRKTELGQKADKLRWFPKLEIDGDALLDEVLQN
jgi:hypothetical protein